MAGIPGKGARIAGQDYCSDGDSDRGDLELPNGLIVENSKGGAGQNDQAAKLASDR